MRIDRIMEWVEGPDVLDVGCTGNGVLLPDSKYWLHGHLRKRYPSVYGIDIAEAKIRQMQNLGFSNVSCQNAEEFEFSNKFNSIVVGELIEHLDNPGKFLDTARNHLANNGRIILTTPYPFALMNNVYAFFKYPKTCSNAEHACWFCPETLRNLATRHGLRTVHFELVGDYLPASLTTKYGLFVRLITLTSPFIPKRLRDNAMLFVLENDENPQNP